MTTIALNILDSDQLFSKYGSATLPGVMAGTSGSPGGSTVLPTDPWSWLQGLQTVLLNAHFNPEFRGTLHRLNSKK